jgi:predicted GNAT family N-acyltransferase
VHAQEQVVGTWKRWGFEVDEGMGRWDEEGIMHVGMFTRLPIGL